MKKVTNYVFVRHRHNWLQFLRFGLVGGSGVLVNQLMTIIGRKVFPHYLEVAVDLPFTDFNIRWYHVITTIAFLVANVWNFQINRSWTFKSGKHAGWFKEFFPFLTTGLVAFFVGQVLITLMLKPGSPFELAHFFPALDDSSGLRTPLYWANLIQIMVTMPINFVVNKLWTFRAVRGHRPGEPDLPLVASVVAPELVDESRSVSEIDHPAESADRNPGESADRNPTRSPDPRTKSSRPRED